MTELAETDQRPSLPSISDNTLPAIDDLTDSLGIPRNILADEEEILAAWENLPRELEEVAIQDDHEEDVAELIAKMSIAVSTGLFDGAINYIWNAAIMHLRDKVRNFGLSVVSKTRDEDFEEDDLQSMKDAELLDLCHQLNIIDKEAYFYLDQCRDQRNNMSAAHPSIGKINDREFINFLNRCVRYAIADSSSPEGVNIDQFISAIKAEEFSEDQKKEWLDRLQNTHSAQLKLIVGTIHGIYCDPSSPESARLNGLELCKELKSEFNNSIKSKLINTHSDYQADGKEKKLKASRNFFENLEMLDLLNDTERHSIFSKAVDNLLEAHKGINNFHNEPPFAGRLLELTEQYEVPETVQEEFVHTVTACFIGNGYGVSRDAKSDYREMIKDFSPKEVKLLIESPENNETIERRIDQNPQCYNRFQDALELIDEESVPDSVKTKYEEHLE